jgi:hypothetical protein
MSCKGCPYGSPGGGYSPLSDWCDDCEARDKDTGEYGDETTGWGSTDYDAEEDYNRQFEHQIEPTEEQKAFVEELMKGIIDGGGNASFIVDHNGKIRRVK